MATKKNAAKPNAGEKKKASTKKAKGAKLKIRTKAEMALDRAYDAYIALIEAIKNVPEWHELLAAVLDCGEVVPFFCSRNVWFRDLFEVLIKEIEG